MQTKLRMRTWEAACIAASLLIVSIVAGVAAYRDARTAARQAEFVEGVAAAFEDPACADFVQRPLTALPRTADLQQHRCLNVVMLRTLDQREGRSAQLSGADIRAWATPTPVSWWQVVLHCAVIGGPVLAFLYGCGLAIAFVACRFPRVASPVRRLVDRVAPGRRRRATVFLLWFVIFVTLPGLGAVTLTALR